MYGNNCHICLRTVGLLGWWSHQIRVWWSKYYFDRLKIIQWVAGLDTQNFLFLFFKVMKKFKNKLKGFLQRILKEIMKKITLGTSDTWSMRRSSRRPSILYWRLSDLYTMTLVFNSRYTPWKKPVRSSDSEVKISRLEFDSNYMLPLEYNGRDLERQS